MKSPKRHSWREYLKKGSKAAQFPSAPSWIENQPIIQYWIISQYKDFLCILRDFDKSQSNHDFLRAKMVLKKTRFYVQTLIDSELYQYEGTLKYLKELERNISKRNYSDYLSSSDGGESVRPTLLEGRLGNAHKA
jgi:hypothetical protein